MNFQEKDWIAIEGAYRANILSNRAIALQYDISEGAIRKRAKQFNWARDPNSTKLEIVKAHFAGSPQPSKTASTRSRPKSTHPPKPDRAPVETISPERVQVQYAGGPQKVASASIEGAAAQDITDMESGLYNARKALEVCGQYLDTQFCSDFETGRMPDPRNLKAVIDANGAAIEQIRRIRSLDSKVGDELEALKILVTAGWIPDELLVAAFGEYRRLKPAIKTTFTSHFEKRMQSGHSEN